MTPWLWQLWVQFWKTVSWQVYQLFYKRWVYVVDAGNRKVSGYLIDPVWNPGSLIELPNSPFIFPTGPTDLAAATVAGGKLKALYVINWGGNDVDECTISSDGSLTFMKQSPVPAGWNPSGIAVDPTNRFAYVCNFSSNDISVYQIDQTSGFLTPYPTHLNVPAGTNPSGLAVSPNGRFVYVTNRGSNDVSAYGIAGDGALVAITPVGVSTGKEPNAIAVHPNGNFAYVTNQLDNTISQYSISVDGNLQQIANPVPGVFSPNDIAVDASAQRTPWSSSGLNQILNFLFADDSLSERPDAAPESKLPSQKA